MDTDTRPTSLFMRNAERLISLFPKEKRAGLWCTAGILYVNYVQIMRRLTFGLYGRPKTETEASEVSTDKMTGPSQIPGVRPFAPYPSSQYDETLSYDEWMTETIAFFRGIGFFAAFRALQDRQVLERLHHKREEGIRKTWADLAEGSLKDQWVAIVRTETGEQEHYHDEPEKYPGSIRFPEYARQQMEKHLEEVRFDRKNDLADLWIAREDETRVWYCDLEQTAGPDSDDYVQVVEEWRKISRGVFEPTNITETWTPIDDHDYGLRIRFEWKGDVYSIEITTPTEWINLDLLRKINELICDSGMRYCIYEAFDQAAYVVVLRAEEKAALEQIRHWKFSA